jgi:hypothetical protein
VANGLTPSDRTEVHIAKAGAPYVILRGPCGSARRPVRMRAGTVGVCGLVADGQTYS